jgi:hypothetical protein
MENFPYSGVKASADILSSIGKVSNKKYLSFGVFTGALSNHVRFANGLKGMHFP